MGQITLKVDPSANNKDELQGVINQLTSLPNAGQFLTRAGSSQSVYLTDNPTSPIVNPGNRAMLSGSLSDYRALDQTNGQQAIIINPNPPDGKPLINTLVHEIGHRKWPGLGSDATQHDPLFYALLNNALRTLGLNVDPQQDLQGVDISNVPVPPAATANPLSYNRPQSHASLDPGEVDTAANSGSWSVEYGSSGFTETQNNTSGNYLQTISYQTNGTDITSQNVSTASGVTGSVSYSTDGSGDPVATANYANSATGQNFSDATYTFNNGSFTDIVKGTGAAIQQEADTDSTVVIEGRSAAVSNNDGNTTLVTDQGASVAVDGGSVGLEASDQTLTSSAGGFVQTATNVQDFVVNGDHQTVTLNPGSEGDTFGNNTSYSLTANSNDVAQVIGDSANVFGDAGNNTVYLDGSNTSAAIVNNSGLVVVTGNNDIVHVDGGTLAIGDNVSGVVVYASNTHIQEGENDDVTFEGSGDTLSQGGDDDNDYDGFDGGSYGGDAGGGGYDPSTGGGGYYYPGGGGYYGGGGGYYDFAGGSKALGGGVDSGQIAAFDRSVGAATAAASAETGLAQAALSAQSIGAEGASLTPVPDGVRWRPAAEADGSRLVTFSFAKGAGPIDEPFSGAIGSEYRPAVQAALQAWSNATGLTFREVADAPTSDIRVGFGDFKTSTSGVLGYTATDALDGTLRNAIVRLEDPSETAVSGSGVDVAYAGADATLYQVALHEIGHALGFADDADVDSVMFASSSGNNRALDATDVAGAQALYGAASFASEASKPASAVDPALAAIASAMGARPGPSPFGTPVDLQATNGLGQLVQAMATFAPQASADVPTPGIGAANAQLAQQLAAPLHH